MRAAAVGCSARPEQLWFTRCSFRGADLCQATLNGFRFKLCDLRGANLSGASLREFSLRAAKGLKSQTRPRTYYAVIGPRL
ncbi:pentapeptide repeat-containing protein [Streptomyces sp. Ncost-T10-10d]|uniref:pentapeptide repeat-containing protein n=1 Tax=Streptomyces sp. Ncost-T10-10d TaxID=1839774 RepID=UPI00210DE07F|nr:pentapeptide repeat-containing protein [Streptomyces sp. Ncost-T10-10d]